MLHRFRAALIHLSGSVGIALLALAVIFLIWYTGPLAAATGVGGIFFILLMVDVIIGPLLTFVVYKPSKKTLRFDLSVIVFLQFLAFSYGMWTIASARPAWLVFNVDRFDLAQAHEIDERQVNGAPIEYQSAPWMGPKWIAAQRPKDKQRRIEIAMEAVAGGPDIWQHPELFVPLEQESDSIRAKGHSLQELERYNAASNVQAILAKWPQADAWLPLKAKVQSMTVLLNKKDAKVIAIVDLRPWN